MSRSKASKELTLNEYKEVMKGIYTTSVNENTLDEAPMAYKSLEAIMDVIQESVNVIEVLKPVYNFKASDQSNLVRQLIKEQIGEIYGDYKNSAKNLYL